MFYALVRRLLRAALGVFYRRIEVVGLESVPRTGPVVFAANHPNSLADAFSILAFVPRRISFMAKSGLFKVPVFGRLLAAVGGVPAYRAQDVPAGERRKNLDSFERVFGVLEGGGAFAIFPEGISHSEPDLAELKTGAARILLGAEERRDFALGAQVVPVGITFSRKEAFRSRVFLAFGEPIPAARFAEQHRQAPRAAIGSLTGAIEEALRGVTLNAETWEDHAAARLLAGMLEREAPTGPAGGIGATLARARGVIAAYGRLREERPDEVARLRARVRRYDRLLRTLGIRDRQVGLRYRPFGVARFVIRNTVVLALGLPIAVAGILAHLVPWGIVGEIARRTRDVDLKSSHAMLAGLVAFPVWWVGLAAGASAVAGPASGATVLVALPVAGAIALRVLDRRREILEDERAFLRWLGRRGTLARLERERTEIVAEARKLGEA
ncbi:MAG: lysophospholipid acyltransferase family protein [Planctomycetales bacterium]|nr:lysophospholipid acyltransferase family protein [Planctomycetales bacterium]